MDKACNYKSGSLPPCAPLALAYVPMQQAAEPVYKPREAISRGTLFPGLDLPFMNIAGRELSGNTPLCELMALDFVADELELYLDTHKDDMEAFAVWKSITKLAAEARKRYTELYGPITQADMLCAGSYTWLNNPWPWDYREEEG